MSGYIGPRMKRETVRQQRLRERKCVVCGKPLAEIGDMWAHAAAEEKAGRRG